MSPNVRLLKLVSAIVVIGALPVLSAPRASAATILSEDFNVSIGQLLEAGWVITNNSAPLIGTTSWFQGEPGIVPAQEGAPTAYAAANFNAAGSGGNVSLWLISPQLTLTGDESLTFFTRTESSAFGDGLEVRYSASLASSDVGTAADSVGDFTTVLLAINNYPESWTQYSISLLGLGGTSGRLAFRYLVTDTSTNGDYIGIDTVRVSSSSTAPVPEPATLTLVGLGIAVVGRRLRRSRT